ncbi:Conserved_hypothetical protein [Hexamita inflata]|uniref:Uncharacterized protein n=1 Tax=Hexamita inflata TaxID=28002 RepID=A0AA86P2H4_9EUKA|nr:Conserved hypothetical protein [Hexamita inflata]
MHQQLKSKSFDLLSFANQVLLEQRGTLQQASQSLEHAISQLDIEENAQLGQLQNLQQQLSQQKQVQQKLADRHAQLQLSNQQSISSIQQNISNLQQSSQVSTLQTADQLEKLLEARFLLQLFNEFLLCRLVGGIVLSLEFALCDKQQVLCFNAQSSISGISPPQKLSFYSSDSINVTDSQISKQQFLQKLEDSTALQQKPNAIQAINAIKQTDQLVGKDGANDYRRIIASPLEDSPLIPPAFRYLLNNPHRRYQALYVLTLLQNNFDQIQHISVPSENLFGENPPRWSLLKLQIIQQAVRSTNIKPDIFLKLHNQTVDFINQLINDIRSVNNVIATPPRDMIISRLKNYQFFFKKVTDKKDLTVDDYQMITNQFNLDIYNKTLCTDYSNKFPRNSELYKLFQALNYKNPNFVAARRICKCIDAIKGDILQLRYLCFEAIGQKLIDYNEPYIDQVIKSDILLHSDIDDPQILQHRLPNLQCYFQQILVIFKAVKRICEICLDQPTETIQKVLTILTESVLYSIQRKLIPEETQAQETQNTAQGRMLNILPCIKLLFDEALKNLNFKIEVVKIDSQAQYYGCPTYGSLNIQLTQLISRTSDKLEELKENLEYPVQLHKYLRELRDNTRKKAQQDLNCLIDSNSDLLYAIDEYKSDQRKWKDILQLNNEDDIEINSWDFEIFIEKKLQNDPQNLMELKDFQFTDLLERVELKSKLIEYQILLQDTYDNLQKTQQEKATKAQQTTQNETQKVWIQLNGKELYVDILKQSNFTNENFRAIEDVIHYINKLEISPQYPKRFYEYSLVLPNYHVRNLLPPLPSTLLFSQDQFSDQSFSFKLQNYQIQHLESLKKGEMLPNIILQAAIPQKAYTITQQCWIQINCIAGQQTYQKLLDNYVQIQTISDKAAEKLFDGQRILEQQYLRSFNNNKNVLEIKKTQYLKLNEVIMNFSTIIDNKIYSEFLFNDLSPMLNRFKSQIQRLLMLSRDIRPLQQQLASALFFTVKKFYEQLEQKINKTKENLPKIVEMICGKYNAEYPQVLPNSLCYRYTADLNQSKTLKQFEALNQVLTNAKTKLTQKNIYVLKVNLQGQPLGFCADYVDTALLFDGTKKIQNSLVYESSNKLANEPNPIIPFLDIIIPMQQSLILITQLSSQHINQIIQLNLQQSQEILTQVIQTQNLFQTQVESFINELFQTALQIQFAALRQIFSLINYDCVNTDKQKNYYQFEHFVGSKSAFDTVPGKPAGAKFIVQSIKNFCMVLKQVPRQVMLRMIASLVQNFPDLYLAHLSRFTIRNNSLQQLAVLDEIRYYIDNLTDILGSLQPSNEQEIAIIQMAQKSFSLLILTKQQLNFVPIDYDLQQQLKYEQIQLLKWIRVRGESTEAGFLEQADGSGIKQDNDFARILREQ